MAVRAKGESGKLKTRVKRYDIQGAGLNAQFEKARLSRGAAHCLSEKAYNRRTCEKLTKQLQRQVRMQESRIRRLTYQNQTDSLTGLLNRAAAEKRIRQFFRTRKAPYFATLLLFDIDNFKVFNDAFGHLNGDDVLKCMGRAMRRVFHTHDILCRWGGDEFMVFCPFIGKDMLIRRIQLLGKWMGQYQGLQGYCPVTLSCGGVHIRQDAAFQKIFQIADNALYEVKKQGRSGYLLLEQDGMIIL